MRLFGLLCLPLLLAGCAGMPDTTARALAPASAAAAAGAAVPTRSATPRQQLVAAPIPTAAQTAVPTVVPTATAEPTPSAEPGGRQGEPAPLLEGELLVQTYSIDFYYTEGALAPETIRAIAAPTELAIISGAARLGSDLAGRVAISFEPRQEGPCAIRGLTLSAERTIRLYYEPDANPERVVAILAHELFHQLQHDYYGSPHLRSDVILLEGMAVWGSSPYFLDPDGHPSYQRRAKEALDAGELLPLTYSLEADCRTASRVNIYNEWASFTEYLLETYGREQLDAVYAESAGREAGSANYEGVYGKPLPTLEAEWISWLAAQVY